MPRAPEQVNLSLLCWPLTCSSRENTPLKHTVLQRDRTWGSALLDFRLSSSPPPLAGVDSLPPSGAAWWNLNESVFKKTQKTLCSIRDLRWRSTSTWLGKPQHRQLCVNSPRSGFVDPGQPLCMNTDGDGVKTRCDESLPFHVSHLVFSRFKIYLQGGCQYESLLLLFLFSIKLHLGPNSCSQVFWFCLKFSGAFVPAVLQLMLNGSVIRQALVHYVPVRVCAGLELKFLKFLITITCGQLSHWRVSPLKLQRTYFLGYFSWCCRYAEVGFTCPGF